MSTGSGAGLNRVYSVVLSNINSVHTTANATPLTSYGNAGNDSGLVLCEAQGFTKWTVSLLNSSGATGLAVSVYGTNDPLALGQWRSSLNPLATKYTLPASSWFLLPGPSEQTGTGSIANPLTPTTPQFQFSGALLGIRVVVTAAASAGNDVSVAVLAVP